MSRIMVCVAVLGKAATVLCLVFCVPTCVQANGIGTCSTVAIVGVQAFPVQGVQTFQSQQFISGGFPVQTFQAAPVFLQQAPISNTTVILENNRRFLGGVGIGGGFFGLGFDRGFRGGFREEVHFGGRR